MTRLKINCIIISIFFYTNLCAQILPFSQLLDVPVFDNNNLLLSNAWAGGFNAPQFSMFNFNNDKYTDLFIFDRSGNTIYPFINTGTNNTVSFKYAPQYTSIFPNSLHDWVLLVDANHDDLPDLFTYNLAGIAFYIAHKTNDSTFYTLQEPQLFFESEFSGTLNIGSNAIDIPAIADINFDGDIDILNFNSAGNFVEYFENQSQERTQTPTDSFIFIKINSCWGSFEEAIENASISLNAECTGYTNFEQRLHTGSTLLAYDYEKDGDCDLILGDVLSNNINFLINGGTAQNAAITQIDTLFPKNNIPVNIQTFPASFLINANNDTRLDLIFAPNEKNKAQSNYQIKLYNNVSNTDTSVYELSDSNFLLSSMIDVGVRSYPVFVDYNNDGALDILIGSYGCYNFDTQNYIGKLVLYKNKNIPFSTEFEWVTNDFNQLSNYNFIGLYPAFGDMDKDGDLDLIIGDEIGSLHYFKNIAPPNQNFLFSPQQFNVINIPQCDAAVPFLFDIDGDSLLDIIVGEKSGTLNYLRNTTPQNSDSLKFILENNFWGNVDVKQQGSISGYSSPIITHLNSSDSLYLLVSSESGQIYAYTDLQNAEFTLISKNFNQIKYSGKAGISCASVFNNNNFQLLVGNNTGGLHIYSQSNISVTKPINNNLCNLKITPIIANSEININFCTSNYPTLLQIYSLTGKLVHTQTVPEQTQNCNINLYNYKSGVYVCVQKMLNGGNLLKKSNFIILK